MYCSGYNAVSLESPERTGQDFLCCAGNSSMDFVIALCFVLQGVNNRNSPLARNEFKQQFRVLDAGRRLGIFAHVCTNRHQGEARSRNSFSF